MNKKLVLKTIICVFCLFFFSFTSKSVSAEELVDYTYNIQANLEGDSTSLLLTIYIKNNDINNVIEGQRITLPFQVSNTTIAFNDSSVDADITQDNSATDIFVNFPEDRKLKKGDTAIITVRFILKNLIKSTSNNFELFIPEFTNVNKIISVNYQLTYPKNFGNPIFTSSSSYRVGNIDASHDVLDVQTDKSLYIIWGDFVERKISATYALENTKDVSLNYLIPLPPRYDNQDVIYQKSPGGKYGLNDSLKNSFSLESFAPNEKKNITFSANIKISSNNNDDFYPDSYEWKLDLSSSEGQKIYSEINKSEDLKEKFKSLNNYLISKTQSNKNESFDLSRVNEIWKRLEGSSTSLNSFEYCYVMVSVADFLGVKSRIDYGYLLAPSIDEINSGNPHIWCEVRIEEKNILLDPFLENLTGISYFDQSPVDRVKFGIWHPSQDYNNALGLASNTKNIFHIDIQDAEHIDTQNNLQLSLDFPTSAFSGEYYTGTLNITNESAYFLSIKSLQYDNADIMENIKVSGLTPAILPQQNNQIVVNGLREQNFLFEGKKDITITLNTSNTNFSEVNANAEMEFHQDSRILMFLLIGLLVSFVVMIVIIVIVVRNARENR